MKKTPCVSEKYKNDPIKFLTKAIGFEKYLPRLQSRADAEYLLTGIINYRMLSSQKKMEYMGYVHNLPGNRTLGIAFYELAAQQVAQPFWYAWSLTDEELRELLEGSKDIITALQVSGIASGVGGVGTSVTGKDIANALLDRSKKGIRTAVSAKVSSNLNMDIADKITSGKGPSLKISARVAAGYITVMASLMFYSAKYDKKRSQDELLCRGLLEETY